MKENKWLLRKMSGARGKYKHNWLEYDRSDYNEDFSDQVIEEKFAKREGMTTKDKNGVDTSLIKKWLYTQVGNNFDDVYAEFLTRIQPKYLDTHKECIYYYVYKPNETKMIDGVLHHHWHSNFFLEMKSGFYINPDTNILCRVVEVKKRTLSHREGKKKHAELLTDRNKSYIDRKDQNEKDAREALDVMKIKKHNEKNK